MKTKVFNFTRELQETPAAKVFITRVMSPLDEFNSEIMLHGKRKIKHLTSDLRIFFNQQRLAQLDPQFLNQLATQISQRKSFGKNIPDNVLIEAIKSRYIQSNADMYHYSRTLTDASSQEFEAIQEQIESIKAAEASAEPSQPVQPTN